MNMSLDLFCSILNSLNVGIEVSDKDYNIVFVNDYELKMTYGNQNVIGRNFLEFFSQKVMDESGMPEAIKTGATIKNRIINYINCSGRHCVANINTYPIKVGNEIIGAFSLGEDITGVCILSQQNLDMQKNGKSSNNKEEISNVNYCINDIIGESSAINKVKEMIMVGATNNANVLITGETGTGKEMVAQSIYSLSRSIQSGPFVAFNCAAVPESLLESILFGTVKGSFTGAENHAGLFEHAQNGVLFLDEINLMPLELQSKLLRAIQERKIRRVGSNEEIPLNFRLIASSNASIADLQNSNSFRKDLFYRLNVISINIPPLRNRKEDIQILAEHFLNKIRQSTNTQVIGFHSDVVDWMLEHNWLGNVRELKNFVERAIYLAKSTMITLDCMDLFNDLFNKTTPSPENYHADNHQERNLALEHFPASFKNSTMSLNDIISQIEKSIIIERLKANAGNASKTARELDIPKQTLHNKLHKYGITKK